METCLRLRAAYGSGSALAYRTRGRGSIVWSAVQPGAINVGGAPNSLTLSPDPGSDWLMLAAQNASSELYYVLWDGSRWRTPSREGSSAGETKNQPFLFLWE